MSSTKHTGECLCGAVKFEIEGEFGHFILCHCSRCQKTSGSAHGANLFSKSAQLKFLSGEDKVRDYLVEGTRFMTTFCTDCGSKLPKDHNGKMLQVPAGSITNGLDKRPDAHIFYASRMLWDHDLDDVPKFDEGLKK
tara:strand:+ start:289332 stop:289742 length:411 start_codon:yes stop_codon:yes gene_type:complete